MAKFTARFNTTLSLAVTVEAEDEEKAGDLAWTEANEYIQTIYGNSRNVIADADLDGIGADEIEEAESRG